MVLNLKGFSQLVQDMSATLQGSASSLVDVSVGSVLRAIFEASASVALWLQWLILQVLQTTRAATSTGADLDSWMNDFGLTRLPACPSTGVVTFSRFSANMPATVPVGAVVKTADGTLSFSVTQDAVQPTWQASSGAYVIPSGVSSANLPVVCNAGGSGGNVLANVVTVIASSLPGVDQVINPAAMSGGCDAETDTAFRARFQNYIVSLSRATLLAVQNAAATVQQGLNILVLENIAANGASLLGSFLVIVDDGSGYPQASLLSAVATAVEAVRPIGTTCAVLPPQVVLVNVQLTAELSAAAADGQYTTGIQQLVTGYLNSLAIGVPASVTRVAQKAYLAGDGIINISSVKLNGQSNDLSPGTMTVVKAGEVTVIINGG